MHLKTRVTALFKLIRFELAFAAGLCVMIGGYIASEGHIIIQQLAFGFMCGFLLAGSANTMNDYFDIEVDKENTPGRPLPSGNITTRGALMFSLSTALAGLFIAFSINMNVFVCCLLVWILGLLYNWKLKQTGLPGNISVAICVASTFIVGSLLVANGMNRYVLLLSLIAFFIDLGEEIAGDAMDAEGDKIRHSKSLAIKYGKEVALKIAAFIFLLVVTISLLPALNGKMNTTHIILLTGVDLIVLIFAWKLMRSKSRSQGLFYMRAIYTAAYLGLAVIYALAFTGGYQTI